MRVLARAVALAAPGVLAGCQRSCLGLDEYRLVGSDFVLPSSTASGTGGAGGSAGEPCDGVPSGNALVAVPVAPGQSLGLPCQAPAAERTAIDVVALDVADGVCVAHARVEALAGTTLVPMARLGPGSLDRMALAAGFRGGAVALPSHCASESAVVVAEEPGAVDGLFVAVLRRVGLAFCTDWARRIWTTTPGASLLVTDLDADADRVALAGSFGGATVQIDAGAGTTTRKGFAFVAEYDGSGTLERVDTLGTVATDTALGVSLFAGGALVTGTLRHEDPACQGCAGESHVSDPAGACDGGGGGGGAGGGGAGGGGGGGGASPKPDTQNAWLWSRLTGDAGCRRFATYGADGGPARDAQIGYHASARFASSCVTYWTGSAGRSAWAWSSADPKTKLAATAGDTVDGFLFATEGATCGVGATYAWSDRLIAKGGDVAWGSRAVALGCGDPSVVAAVQVSGAPTALGVERCSFDGQCEARSLGLAVSSTQLVVLRLERDGDPVWYAALGVDPAGALGAPRAALGRDEDDGLYVLFTTTGPLDFGNIDARACRELARGAKAGTFVVALDPSGSFGATCRWARRLGP
jgi:hypothetical protein